MIIEIALGIVLAVIILRLLPWLLAVGILLALLALAVLIAVLVWQRDPWAGAYVATLIAVAWSVQAFLHSQWWSQRRLRRRPLPEPLRRRLLMFETVAWVGLGLFAGGLIWQRSPLIGILVTTLFMRWWGSTLEQSTLRSGDGALHRRFRRTSAESEAKMDEETP